MSRRTTDYDRPIPKMGAGWVVLIGLGVGIAGTAGMSIGQKMEQAITGRPNSLVPGLALARMLGRPDSDKGSLTLPMQWGLGTIVAVSRAFLSLNGIRGPFVDFVFTGMRITVDQILENATGAGALPWTWPVSEQIIDLAHKGIYAFVTGYLCDLFIQ